MKRLQRFAKVFITILMLICVFGGLSSAQADPILPSHYHITDLGTLGGSNSWTLSNNWGSQIHGMILAPAINDHGDIIGYSETKKGYMEPFLWKNGRMQPLVPSRNWHVTEIDPRIISPCLLISIHKQGQIVGVIDINEGFRAFLTDGAKFRFIGSSFMGGPFKFEGLYPNRGLELRSWY